LRVLDKIQTLSNFFFFLFEDDVSGFFCLNLEEITEERVAFSRLNFEKAAEESKKN